MAKAGDNRKAEHSEYQEPLRLYNGFYKGFMRDLGLRAQSMWFMGFRGSALNSQPPNPETPNPKVNQSEESMTSNSAALDLLTLARDRMNKAFRV